MLLFFKYNFCRKSEKSMATDKALQKLTPKEERFCYEYLANGFNASKAALKAGYSQKTAYIIGHENLKKPKIHARIQAMKDNLAETAGISALMIAHEHAKIAFSSVANLHNTWIERKALDELSEDERACIQEVSTKVVKVKNELDEYNDVEYIKIKTYDKQKSLEALSDLLGYKAPVRQEITGKDGRDLFNRLSDEDLDAKLLDLERKMKK